jgi:hypothetical protein
VESVKKLFSQFVNKFTTCQVKYRVHAYRNTSSTSYVDYTIQQNVYKMYSEKLLSGFVIYTCYLHEVTHNEELKTARTFHLRNIQKLTSSTQVKICSVKVD